jgi:hypothetical protein
MIAIPIGFALAAVLLWLYMRRLEAATLAFCTALNTVHAMENTLSVTVSPRFLKLLRAYHAQNPEDWPSLWRLDADSIWFGSVRADVDASAFQGDLRAWEEVIAWPFSASTIS